MIIAITASAEKVFQFAVFIIMGDVLCTITVSNKNIAIGIYCRFGGYKLLCSFVNTGFKRYIYCHQQLPVNRGFINLVLHRVGNE
jgi:hypothetical protein